MPPQQSPRDYERPQDVRRGEAGRWSPPLGSNEGESLQAEGKYWLLNRLGKLGYCRYKGNGRCSNTNCRYGHIRHPLGPRLKQIKDAARRLVENHIHYARSYDSSGMLWWSAGYECPATGVLFFAEQGGGILGAGGVFWYTRREEALKSLGDTVQTARGLDR